MQCLQLCASFFYETAPKTFSVNLCSVYCCSIVTLCCRIPEGLTRLVGLVELYLNDAFLESLPNSFGRLVPHFFAR